MITQTQGYRTTEGSMFTTREAAQDQEVYDFVYTLTDPGAKPQDGYRITQSYQTCEFVRKNWRKLQKVFNDL